MCLEEGLSLISYAGEKKEKKNLSEEVKKKAKHLEEREFVLYSLFRLSGTVHIFSISLW
jgi:hypothetical protein